MAEREPEILLTPRELAQRWKTSLQSLANRRSAGKGPRFIRIGRSIRYRLSDVEEYLAQNTVEPNNG